MTTLLQPATEQQLLQDVLIRRLERCVYLELALAEVLADINQEECPVTPALVDVLTRTRRLLRTSTFAMLVDVLDYGTEETRRDGLACLTLLKDPPQLNPDLESIPDHLKTQVMQFITAPPARATEQPELAA